MILHPSFEKCGNSRRSVIEVRGPLVERFPEFGASGVSASFLIRNPTHLKPLEKGIAEHLLIVDPFIRQRSVSQNGQQEALVDREPGT